MPTIKHKPTGKRIGKHWVKHVLESIRKGQTHKLLYIIKALPYIMRLLKKRGKTDLKKEKKCVGAESLRCKKTGKEVYALLIIFENGFVDVKCPYKKECGINCAYIRLG